ncbi:hypothetical protein M0813_28771 [Anaeramoeba flamelloides]|uniref:Uncharacterized protein n=1 Tax=Anaeramoeba flamelloides TaxID=1746091 RepID=A0ABQ8XR46_9EUKA|nr:hypothetical protein M0813_28771 [Anaeramoeba flamelloides]
MTCNSVLFQKTTKKNQNTNKQKNKDQKFTNLEHLEISSSQKSSQIKKRIRTRTKKKKKKKKKTKPKLLSSYSDLSILYKNGPKKRIRIGSTKTNNNKIDYNVEKNKNKNKNKNINKNINRNKNKSKNKNRELSNLQKTKKKGSGNEVFEPIFRYQNILSDNDSSDPKDQNQKLNDEERFLKIFQNISETGTPRNKFEEKEFEIDNDSSNDSNNENENLISQFDTFIFQKNSETVAKSCPIPIHLNINQEIQSSNTSEQDQEDFFFIQPHKYLESQQSKRERELNNAFNVPLKRVPSWKVLNLQNSSNVTLDLEN